MLFRVGRPSTIKVSILKWTWLKGRRLSLIECLVEDASLKFLVRIFFSFFDQVTDTRLQLDLELPNTQRLSSSTFAHKRDHSRVDRALRIFHCHWRFLEPSERASRTRSTASLVSREVTRARSDKTDGLFSEEWILLELEACPSSFLLLLSHHFSLLALSRRSF